MCFGSVWRWSAVGVVQRASRGASFISPSSSSYLPALPFLFFLHLLDISPFYSLLFIDHCSFNIQVITAHLIGSSQPFHPLDITQVDPRPVSSAAYKTGGERDSPSSFHRLLEDDFQSEVQPEPDSPQNETLVDHSLLHQKTNPTFALRPLQFPAACITQYFVPLLLCPALAPPRSA